MEITIDKLGINGEGVGRIAQGENKDKVCFVDFLLPGESAEIDIIKDTLKYSKGKIVKIRNNSKDRVKASCPYFEKCGGCDIQHLTKESQIVFKKNLVKETIEKIAKIDANVEDVIRLNDYNYRNKMVFPIVKKNNKIVIGMFESQSHNVVEIKECKIANKNINLILNNAQEFFNKNMVDDYGYLRYLVVREIGCCATITIVSVKKIDLNKYYANLEKLPIKCGLSMVVNNDKNNILSGKYYNLYGNNSLDLIENKIKYSVDNLGFLQVNNNIKSRMYKNVIECIDCDEIVVDGYCGAGLLTAIISKKCKKAIGVDVVPSSIKSAQNLASKNLIKNIEFYLGDFKLVLPKILKQYINITLLLDPPRSGCDSEVINMILDANKSKDCKIDKIIYISCNPATLARDLGIFKSDYEITKIQPMDMFPQTRHIETLVCLQRRV